MLPSEEACFRTVLSAAQDHAEAMLACGGTVRPTGLLLRMAASDRIDEAALVDLAGMDRETVHRFVQANARRKDVDAIGLSCLMRPDEMDGDLAGCCAGPNDVLVIYLITRYRETWVVNDIDAATGRLQRGELDPGRISRTFLN